MNSEDYKERLDFARQRVDFAQDEQTGLFKPGMDERQLIIEAAKATALIEIAQALREIADL